MFVVKKSSEMVESDFNLFLSALFQLVDSLEAQGAIQDVKSEKIRIEKDLRFFFRDDKSVIYKYVCDENISEKRIGVVGVRTLGPNTIYVHQLVAADIHCSPKVQQDIVKQMISGLKELYPDHKAYGVVHKHDKRLREFLRTVGAQECDVLYLKEHPFSDPENGWMAWSYDS